MKKYLIFIWILLLTGCGVKGTRSERAQTGHIGADMAISREMAAKTIGLAFY